MALNAPNDTDSRRYFKMEMSAGRREDRKSIQQVCAVRVLKFRTLCNRFSVQALPAAAAVQRGTKIKMDIGQCRRLR